MLGAWNPSRDGEPIWFWLSAGIYVIAIARRVPERAPVPIAGDGETDHRGMADRLQHRASAQQPWRVGTRRVYEPPPLGAYGHRS
jgi:hypothetical protein